MTPFFRRIRRKLANDNQIFKYSKYAIGEIALVVIGILIALQINNWNEKRKLDLSKEEYYNQILVDLNKEIENINSRMVALDSSIASTTNYWNYISTADLKQSELINELSKVELEFKHLTFNTNTIQTLEATGDIKVIPESIRHSLLDLMRLQNGIGQAAAANYEIYLSAQQEAFGLGFLRFKYGFPKVEELEIENNLPKIILTLEGALGLKNFTDNMVKRRLAEMLIDINNIKEMITSEISLK